MIQTAMLAEKNKCSEDLICSSLLHDYGHFIIDKPDDLVRNKIDGNHESIGANYLKDFYTLAFSHPSVTSITFWNMTDQNAWRGHAGGLLFKDLKPKKAFDTLKFLINEKWTTKINQNINSSTFNFTGFYGKYQGKIIVNNKEYNFEFHHSKSNKDLIKIYL